METWGKVLITIVIVVQLIFFMSMFNGDNNSTSSKTTSTKSTSSSTSSKPTLSGFPMSEMFQNCEELIPATDLTTSYEQDDCKLYALTACTKGQGCYIDDKYKSNPRLVCQEFITSAVVNSCYDELN
ncbi:MAG: hypothetical protein KAQ83_00505 [Nanoarchaeota archaeon]|nr:hypothetical protein [Nanoarchaeota archaeon]